MNFEIKTLESISFPFATEFTIALTDDWNVVCVNNTYIDIDTDNYSDLDVAELEAIAYQYDFDCFGDMLVSVPSDILSIDELWDFLDSL